MVNKYNVVEILGAVEDIVDSKESLMDVQKKVVREDEDVSSSEATAFEIDEIQKITPEIKEKIEQSDKFDIDKKLSNAIPPETEKLITKAEQNLEINESEKKDKPLILTNTQKTEDVLKSKVTNEILETQNNPKTESQITNLDNELSSSTKHITLLKDELKIQSGLVRTQQNKIREYQESISNLKERISKFEGQENKLYEENAQLKENLKRVSKEIKPQNDVNNKMLEAEKRIKYYQEDNLRLSNTVGTLSKRLDNTKHQLVSYESNKQQIMSEIKNLNNVISRSNIIDNKFGSTVLESDKIIINDDGQVTKKINQKIKNTEDLNILVKEIFKK